MAGYYIFVPDAHGTSPDILKSVGLYDIFDWQSGLDAVEILANGPDGLRGTLFLVGQVPYPSLDLTRQAYTKLKQSGELAEGRAYLGRDLFAQPTPDSLLRKGHLGGTPVELANGTEWLVPVARMLPHTFTLNEQGVPVRKVKSVYESYYERSAKAMGAFLGHSPGQDLTIPEGWSLAVQALTLNYQVTAEVIDWLALLDDASLLRAITATFEMNEAATVMMGEATKYYNDMLELAKTLPQKKTG